MTDPQLHHARWVPKESVVAFWEVFITPPVHSSRKRRNIFSYHNPYQKQIRAAHRLHKHYTSCACSSATFKLFNTPVHNDRKVKNL